MLILLELWQNKHTKSWFITHDIVAKMQQCCLVTTIISSFLITIIIGTIIIDSHKLSLVIIY